MPVLLSPPPLLPQEESLDLSALHAHLAQAEAPSIWFSAGSRSGALASSTLGSGRMPGIGEESSEGEEQQGGAEKQAEEATAASPFAGAGPSGGSASSGGAPPHDAIPPADEAAAAAVAEVAAAAAAAAGGGSPKAAGPPSAGGSSSRLDVARQLTMRFPTVITPSGVQAGAAAAVLLQGCCRAAAGLLQGCCRTAAVWLLGGTLTLHPPASITALPCRARGAPGRPAAARRPRRHLRGRARWQGARKRATRGDAFLEVQLCGCGRGAVEGLC